MSAPLAAAHDSRVSARPEERAVILQAGGERLFGILTVPPLPRAGARAGVLYLTRPRSHRNRIWVDAAREMARRGFWGLRIDYHGEGDSTGRSLPLWPEAPYAADAAAAIEWLVRSEGLERVALAGSCFDARTALAAVHTAPRFDGLVFMSAPVLDERNEMERLVAERDMSHYLRRIVQPGAWRALVSAERLGLALRILGTRFARAARPASRPNAGGGDARARAPHAPRGTSAIRPSDAFLRDFRALVARSAPALFLYGDDDDQYPGFRLVMDRELPQLSPAQRARFEIAVLPGEAHGYLSIAMQRAIAERAISWLEGTLEREGRT